VAHDTPAVCCSVIRIIPKKEGRQRFFSAHDPSETEAVEDGKGSPSG
jgi:hypothetical protein